MTSIEDVHKVYEQTLHIENHHIIDVPLAMYVAKSFSGEKLWLTPYQSSGIGKTTAILPLMDLAFDWKYPETKDNLKYRIFFVDNLTPATFASGDKKEKIYDLGHWLENQSSLLIISDLAPILSMEIEIRNKLFGNFRTLFDGYIKVDTSKVQKYYKNIHLNMLAFATKEVRQELELQSILGTRDIAYELPPIKDIWKAMLFDSQKVQNGKERRANIVKDYLDDLSIPEENELQYVPTALLRKLAYEGSIWRTPTITDKYGHLIAHTEPEYPMRLKHQFEILFKSLTLLGINEANTTKILLEIGANCGNSIRKEILISLFTADEEGNNIPMQQGRTPLEIANKLNISTQYVLTQLMALRDMKVVAPVLDFKKSDDVPNIFNKNRTKWIALGSGVYPFI